MSGDAMRFIDIKNIKKAAFFYNGARDFLKTYIDSGKINVISGQDEFAKVVTDSWSTEKAEKRFKNIIKSYYSDG